NWFEQELITSDGTRGIVHQGETLTGSLKNAIVERLSKEHIIRRERRADAIWYELVHDRFVQPIIVSNEHWRKTQLDQERRLAASLSSQLRRVEQRYEEITSTEQSLWE